MNLKLSSLALVLILFIVNTSSHNYTDNFNFTLCKTSCDSLVGSVYRLSKFATPLQQAQALLLDLLNPKITFKQLAAKMNIYSYATRFNHLNQQRSFRSIYKYGNAFLKKYNQTRILRRNNPFDSRSLQWIQNGVYRQRAINVDQIMYVQFFDEQLLHEVMMDSMDVEEYSRRHIRLMYPFIPINRMGTYSPFIPYAGQYIPQFGSRANQFDIIEWQQQMFDEYFNGRVFSNPQDKLIIEEQTVLTRMNQQDLLNYIRYGYLPHASVDQIHAFASVVFGGRFGNQFLASWQSCTARKYSLTC